MDGMVGEGPEYLVGGIINGDVHVYHVEGVDA